MQIHVKQAMNLDPLESSSFLQYHKNNSVPFPKWDPLQNFIALLLLFLLLLLLSTPNTHTHTKTPNYLNPKIISKQNSSKIQQLMDSPMKDQEKWSHYEEMVFPIMRESCSPFYVPNDLHR